MNKRTRTFVVYGTLSAVVVAAGGLAYEAVRGSSPASAGTTATRLVSASMGDVTQTVTSSGTIAPAAAYSLDFATAGVVTAVDVSAGQAVRAGQVLATEDQSRQKVNLQSAQANLSAAQEKLSQAQNPLSALQATQDAASLAQAQDQLNGANSQLAADQATLSTDQATLTADQSGTSPGSAGKVSADQQAVTRDQQAVTRDQDSLSSAQANLANVTAQNAAKAAVDPSAVAVAQAGVASARLAVTQAGQALAGTTLTAPVAGTVSVVNEAVGASSSGSGTVLQASSSSSSSGGSSSAAKGFGTLLDLSHDVVQVGFAEADAGKVAVGQPVTITVAALPGQSFTGKVAEIDTTSTVVQNVVTYDSLTSFDSVPASLKPGMTANVSVTTAEADNVVEIPSAAISTRGGSSTVTVESNGAQQSVPVQTGLVGDGTTQIVSGLSAGDQVVMSIGVVTSSGSSSGSGSNRTGGGGFGGGGGGFRIGG